MKPLLTVPGFMIKRAGELYDGISVGPDVSPKRIRVNFYAPPWKIKQCTAFEASSHCASPGGGTLQGVIAVKTALCIFLTRTVATKLPQGLSTFLMHAFTNVLTAGKSVIVAMNGLLSCDVSVVLVSRAFGLSPSHGLFNPV